MNTRHWIRFAALACTLTLGACSSFEKEWKSAAQAGPAARKADPFGGAWDGQWTSAKHRRPTGPGGGRLRCLFTRVDDAHYRAKFHANWLVFATGYEVTFDTKRRGDLLLFTGEHDLGAIFGGVYRYKGSATPRHFSASFASSSDHGRFEMSRPASPRGD